MVGASPRDITLDLASNAFITAIVGPRRAGKKGLLPCLLIGADSGMINK
jgi:predicted AAA+ superfamily ATPase